MPHDPSIASEEETPDPREPGASQPQESVDPEAQLAEALAESERLRDEWLRARAETDNVRRRSQDDVARAHRYGLEGFAGALLAVKDSLDAALAVENATVESFKEGVQITARQLEGVFQKHAITEVVPQGQKFDPHRHQAISQVESDQEPGTVVTVLQKGYLLHDRVLRPALVVVAREKATEPGTPAT